MTLTGIAGASPAIAGLCGVRAVAFDFNGTITRDDELRYLLYAETAAELGVELDRPFFRARLGGPSDRDLSMRSTVPSACRHRRPNSSNGRAGPAWRATWLACARCRRSGPTRPS
ncbi:hypothetical protein [Nonomuraea sp. NPDC050540]|uniref:hypothetical protein n=1 Tax=Nonomuraea sp. NPDC050540 TaxID=3364367 RepID=UPI0037AE8210